MEGGGGSHGVGVARQRCLLRFSSLGRENIWPALVGAMSGVRLPDKDFDWRALADPDGVGRAAHFLLSLSHCPLCVEFSVVTLFLSSSSNVFVSNPGSIESDGNWTVEQRRVPAAPSLIGT